MAITNRKALLFFFLWMLMPFLGECEVKVGFPLQLAAQGEGHIHGWELSYYVVTNIVVDIAAALLFSYLFIRFTKHLWTRRAFLWGARAAALYSLLNFAIIWVFILFNFDTLTPVILILNAPGLPLYQPEHGYGYAMILPYIVSVLVYFALGYLIGWLSERWAKRRAAEKRK